MGTKSVCNTSDKLLGVYISSDLMWNINCHYTFKKALICHSCTGDPVILYCSLIQSIPEYASPLWAALPDYINNLIESVQKKALSLIFPD